LSLIFYDSEMSEDPRSRGFFSVDLILTQNLSLTWLEQIW